MTAPVDPLVIWHDIECGSYTADLPLWRELAAAARGPVLDVGAGTGRVALDLAAHGHDVVALDREPALLTALGERARARGLSIQAVCADAAGFALDARSFALVIVPMQTVQLLGDRGAFLRAARRHLRPGGVLAAALADPLEGFAAPTDVLPLPDEAEHGGWRYLSQPVAVRPGARAATIERIRTTLAPDGARTAQADVIELAALTPAELEGEGRAAGFEPEPGRRIAATEEHVGSEVVLLRG